MTSLFEALGLGGEKVLLLTSDYDVTIAKSVRNLKNACSQKAAAASTRDLMDCTALLLQKSALSKLLQVLDHAA
jgi:ribosomal protein L4